MATRKTLNGIDVEAFNRWKHHPVTELFRRYLTAKEQDIINSTIETWRSGQLDQVASQEAAGAANTFKIMAELLGPDGDLETEQPAFDQIFQAMVDMGEKVDEDEEEGEAEDEDATKTD